MRRAVLAAALATLAGASPAAAQSACTKTWAGPAAGSWNVAGSWSPAGVPGAGDVVCLPAGTDTTANATSTIAVLRSDGIVRVTTALTLTSTTEPSVVEDLRLAAGLGGAGDLEADTLTWTSGTMSGTGTTTVREHHTIAGGAVGDGRSLVTEGTGTWTGSPAGAGGAVWTNRAAITFGPGDLDASLVGGVRPRFVNEAAGSVLRTTGTGNFNVEWRLENDGTLGRAPVDGVGAVFVDHGAPGTSTGAFVGVGISATDLQLEQGARLERVSISGDVTTGPGEFPWDDGQLAGGNLRGRGTLVLGGAFDAWFGRLGEPGQTVVLPAGATLNWRASFGITASRFETAGEVTIAATGANEVQVWGTRTVWENTGTVRVRAGRVRTAPANTGNVSEAAVLLNRGTLVKETTGTFTFDPVVLNDGVIDVQLGRLATPRFEQTPDGTLRFAIAGTTAATTYGALTATRLGYGGRLEAVLAGGFAPAPGARFDVVQSAAANRSGAFGSTSLAGLQLDEAQAGTIGLVQPAAPGLATLAAAAAGTTTTAADARTARLTAQQTAAVRAQRARHARRARRARGAWASGALGRCMRC